MFSIYVIINKEGSTINHKRGVEKKGGRQESPLTSTVVSQVSVASVSQHKVTSVARVKHEGGDRPF